MLVGSCTVSSPASFHVQCSGRVVKLADCGPTVRGFEFTMASLVTYVRTLNKLSLKYACSDSPSRISRSQLTWGLYRKVNSQHASFRLSCYGCKIKVLCPSFIDFIAPIILRIVNLSLSSGVFPKHFKFAVVKPLLKNFKLVPNNLKKYHPISNLSFISKLIEHVIVVHLSSHFSSHNLMSTLQSAYRKFRSSVTALLYVTNDILALLDAGHSTAQLLIDLLAAFDTIDYNIFIYRLQHWFGISSTALNSQFFFLLNRS